MKIDGVNNTKYNQNFSALKVKNPKAMPTEILSQLSKIKELFKEYPNASVRYSGLFKRFPNFWLFYNLKCLTFDLGDKKLGKFRKFSYKGCSRGIFYDLCNVNSSIEDAEAKARDLAKSKAYRNGLIRELTKDNTKKAR